MNEQELARTCLMEAALKEIIDICDGHLQNIHGHPLFNSDDIRRIAMRAIENDGE